MSNSLFEVTCYANLGGNALDEVMGISSLEGCAAACAAWNEAIPGRPDPCVGATFVGSSCYRKKSYGNANFDQGAKAVRLISSGYGYPAINDQMYPFPNIASSTICAGPSSTAYAYQTVVPQRTFQNVNQWTGNLKYEVECQRQISGTVTTGVYLANFLAGNSFNSYEDCLRYCQYSNENSDGSCRGFNYDPSSTAVCTLYSLVSGITAQLGVSGGRWFGGGYSNATDRPAGFVSVNQQ